MRRILLVLLSLGWGAVVYFYHRRLDVDGALIVLRMKSGVLHAVLAAIPVCVGAVLLSLGDEKWRPAARWAYAVLLGVLIAASWGGVAVVPYSLAAVITLWPELWRWLTRGRIRGWPALTALWAGVLGLFVWWQWLHNPLPSDEEMLRHFNTHRADFEQLVQGYRNYRQKGVLYEKSSPEVYNMMKKVGLYGIVEASGSAGCCWYPEPYSERTLQIRKSLEIRTSKTQATGGEIIATLRRDLPELFENIAPIQNLGDKNRVTCVIDLYPGRVPLKQPNYKVRLCYLTLMHKGYYYFPQPPRVENNRIVLARYSLVDHAYTHPGQRVLDSLDSYPPNWERGECVLKRIDDHWFITMCRGAN